MKGFNGNRTTLTKGDPIQSHPNPSTDPSISLAIATPIRVSVASLPARGTMTQNPNATEPTTNANRAFITTGRRGCTAGSHPDHKANATIPAIVTTVSPTEVTRPSTSLAR